MEKLSQNALQIPAQYEIADSNKLLSRPWLVFFRSILNLLDFLGLERIFEIENNKTTATNIVGLNFDKSSVSQAKVDYLIQRITTGAGAQELVESGTLYLIYKPITDTWQLFKVDIPTMNSSGITFSITSSGQIKYTSTNITGIKLISKIAFRALTIASKDKYYSKVGA